jgi:hypothetical protein
MQKIHPAFRKQPTEIQKTAPRHRGIQGKSNQIKPNKLNSFQKCSLLHSPGPAELIVGDPKNSA